MSEIDIDVALKAALNKRWPGGIAGSCSIGGWGVQGWDTSKVQLRIVQMEYPGFAKAEVKTPTILAEADFSNDTEATIDQDFSYSNQTDATSEWHVTGGLKLKAGAKGKAGVPLVAEGEVSASVELDFEAGGGGKFTETKSWGAKTAIHVPPHTDLKAEALLTVGTVKDQSFIAHVEVYGQIGAICVTSSGPNPSTWTQWADIVTGKGWVTQNFAPVGKPPLDLADTKFTAEGTYSGTAGLYVSVTTTPLKAAVGTRL